LNEEKIKVDLVVKDQIFHKKIIIYFIFLALFFPLVIISGILPTINYKRYMFEIDGDININFNNGELKFKYDLKEEIINYKVKKYNFIFILGSLL